MILMAFTARMFDLVQLSQIGLALGTLLAVVYSTFMAKMAQIRALEAKTAAEEAAVKIKQELKLSNEVREAQDAKVKQDLEAAAQINDRKLAVLHILANSGMAVQKKLVAELSEEIARMTNDDAHHRRAVAAREVYDDHMRRQQVVDRSDAEKMALSIAPIV